MASKTCFSFRDSPRHRVQRYAPQTHTCRILKKSRSRTRKIGSKLSVFQRINGFGGRLPFIRTSTAHGIEGGGEIFALYCMLKGKAHNGNLPQIHEQRYITHNTPPSHIITSPKTGEDRRRAASPRTS